MRPYEAFEPHGVWKLACSGMINVPAWKVMVSAWAADAKPTTDRAQTIARVSLPGMQTSGTGGDGPQARSVLGKNDADPMPWVPLRSDCGPQPVQASQEDQRRISGFPGVR